MEDTKRVFYCTEDQKVFECFVDKEPVMVEAIIQPCIVLNERYIEHIKRCMIQPNVSGLLDVKMVAFYHKYKLIDDEKYLYFHSCVNDLKFDED